MSLDDVKDESAEVEAVEERAADTQAAEAVEQSAPDPVEAKARRMGWKPEADWRGDKTEWVPASAYVTHKLEEQVSELKAGQRKLMSDMSKVRQSGYDQAVKEITARHEQAVAEGNVVEARKAADELADIKAEAPEKAAPKDDVDPDLAADLADFKARNPWFDRDAAKRAYASALSQQFADEGMEKKEQLAAVERQMRKEFPALYTSRPAVSSVEGGSPPRAKTKSFSDMPAEEREMADYMIKNKVFKTREEAAAKYFAGEKR